MRERLRPSRTQLTTGQTLTMKVATGGDFITMPLYASRLTGPSWRKGAVFLPQPTSAILGYAPPRYLPTSSRGERRARAQRHNPHSIATLRIKIARFLVLQRARK